MRPKAEWVIDSEAMRGRGIIFLTTLLASETRFSRHCFGFQSRRFSLLVDYIENTSWKVLAYGIYVRVVDVSEIERVSAERVRFLSKISDF